MNHPLDKDGYFLAKWLESDGHKSLSPNDEHYTVLNSTKEIIDHVDAFKEPKLDKASLFEKINADISKTNKNSKRKVLKFVIGLLVFFSIVFTGFYFFNNQVKITTPFGTQLKHKLPDNSDVFLNANTQIVYKSDFNESRHLKLTGEAFFEVEKGSKFNVETELGTVEVLGTSFNVIAHREALKVSCKTGKVKVIVGGEEFMLTPGKELVYAQSKIRQNDINLNEINKWESGVSSFERTPLSMVVKSLEDWYEIEVEINDDFYIEEYTGSFVHNDLDKALKMVFLPMGLKYTLKDNKLVLIQK